MMASSGPLHLRVFLSSPGDVADERGIAMSVLDGMPYDPLLIGRVTYQAVSWDRPGSGVPLLASLSPQTAIDRGLPRPSECDIVVVVLWTRLGTPLPYPDYATADGQPVESGTLWELDDAVRASRTHGSPDVLLYRRTARALIDPDAGDADEALAQRRLVNEFFAGLHDPETGALLAGYRTYQTPDEFRIRFEADIKELTRRRLEAAEAIPVAPGQLLPLWQGSPFPGLRPFTPEDAPIYFGRGRETDELLARLGRSHFVAVVGASGSGKSSLVGAGLIPRLAAGALPSVGEWLLPEYDRRHNVWHGLRLTPAELGDDPFIAFAAKLAPLVQARPRELAAELASRPECATEYVKASLAGRPPTAAALVFVDQLEELFVTVHEGRIRTFVRLLATLSECPFAYVIATLRADFYARCLLLPELSRQLERGELPLAPPQETLLDMITRPAARAALELEEGLAAQVLADLDRAEGALPLLAYTLDELYRGRGDGFVLTLAGYRALGGVHGAIGKRAEAVYAGLDRAAQDRFREVFRELVEVDDAGNVTRRRAPLSVVAGDPPARRLVDACTEARLVVTSSGVDHEPVVAVAHEALFSSWPRLRELTAKMVEDLRLLRKATAAARDWDQHGRADAYRWPHERIEPVRAAIDRLGRPPDALTLSFLAPEHEALVAILGDPGTESYRRAATADRLVEIGAASVPGLLEALKSWLPAVRIAAADALGRIGGPAVPGLVTAAASESADVRLAALLALRRTEDPHAFPAFVRALRDEDERVRSVAAGALQATRGSAGLPARGAAGTDNSGWVAVGVRGPVGESDVVELLDQLHDSDDQIRDQARAVITAVGTMVVDRVVEILRDPHARNRIAAAEALAAIGAAAVPGLLEALRDPNPDTRWRAAEALGGVGDAAAWPGLRAALRDREPVVRQAAAAALRGGAKPTVEALTDALADDDVETRQTAMRALADIGPSAITGLCGVLTGPQRGPAPALAAAAVGRIGPAVTELLKLLRHRDRRVRCRAAGAIAAIGPPAVPMLCDALADPETVVQTGAVAALREIGDPAAAAVAARWDDPRPVARQRVAEVLETVDGPTVHRALVRLLADPEPAVATAAALALAARGERALPALFTALEKGEPMRAAAVRAFTTMGGVAVRRLLDVAGTQDRAAAAAAIDALTAIATPAALLGLAALGRSHADT